MPYSAGGDLAVGSDYIAAMKSLSAPLMALIGAGLIAVNGEVGGPPEAHAATAILGFAVVICSLITWMITVLRRD